MKSVINTDAHKKQTLNHMKIGISTAKKGWMKKSTVLNINKQDLLAFLHNDNLKAASMIRIDKQQREEKLRAKTCIESIGI